MLMSEEEFLKNQQCSDTSEFRRHNLRHTFTGIKQSSVAPL
jgi:hypothetical protein